MSLLQYPECYIFFESIFFITFLLYISQSVNFLEQLDFENIYEKYEKVSLKIELANMSFTQRRTLPGANLWPSGCIAFDLSDQLMATHSRFSGAFSSQRAFLSSLLLSLFSAGCPNLRSIICTHCKGSGQLMALLSFGTQYFKEKCLCISTWNNQQLQIPSSY